MPQEINLKKMVRVMTYTDSFFMIMVTLFIAVSWVSVFSVIASLLAIIRMVHLIKHDIQVKHNGSFKEWLKFFVKKNV